MLAPFIFWLHALARLLPAVMICALNLEKTTQLAKAEWSRLNPRGSCLLGVGGPLSPVLRLQHNTSVLVWGRSTVLVGSEASLGLVLQFRSRILAGQCVSC